MTGTVRRFALKIKANLFLVKCLQSQYEFTGSAFQIQRFWFHFETQSHLFELDWRLLRHKSHSPANWSLTKFKTVEGAAMGLLMQGRSGRDDAPVNRMMPKCAKLTSWYVLEGSWKLPILSCAFVKDCVFLFL